MRILVALMLALAACGGTCASRAESRMLRERLYATVLIDAELSSGSGTIVHSDDHSFLVLTCAHVVVHAAGKMRVVSPFVGTHDAEVVALDAEHDLALLRVAHPGRVPHVRVARTEPRMASRVFVMGSPHGDFGQVSEGFITGLRVSDERLPHQTSYRISGAFVYPGISGGTALNEDGELVCVPSAVGGDENGYLPQMGYCVSLGDVWRFLKPYRL